MHVSIAGRSQAGRRSVGACGERFGEMRAGPGAMFMSVAGDACPAGGSASRCDVWERDTLAGSHGAARVVRLRRCGDAPLPYDRRVAGEHVLRLPPGHRLRSPTHCPIVIVGLMRWFLPHSIELFTTEIATCAPN